LHKGNPRLRFVHPIARGQGTRLGPAVRVMSNSHWPRLGGSPHDPRVLVPRGLQAGARTAPAHFREVPRRVRAQAATARVRFFARLVAVVGDAATLKGGLVLKLRLERARTTMEVDLGVVGSPDDILARLQESARHDLADFYEFRGRSRRDSQVPTRASARAARAARLTATAARRRGTSGIKLVAEVPVFGVQFLRISGWCSIVISTSTRASSTSSSSPWLRARHPTGATSAAEAATPSGQAPSRGRTR
jgi:hypothetical protein